MTIVFMKTSMNNDHDNDNDNDNDDDGGGGDDDDDDDNVLIFENDHFSLVPFNLVASIIHPQTHFGAHVRKILCW